MPLPFLIPIAVEIAKMAAPELARWLAGDRAADVATRIVDTASVVAGGGTPQEILDRLKASADLTAKTSIELHKLDNEMEAAYLADVASARQRDVAIQAGGRRNYRADILAGLAVAGMVACLVAGTWLGAVNKFSSDMAVLISTAMTWFGGTLAAVYNFEFGSSRSSKDHSATIAAALKNGTGS